MFPQEQIDCLKTLYPGLSMAEEGGLSFILIENLKLPEGCEPRVVKGLLCPMKRDGYPSRLFISAKVSHKGKGQNWNPTNGCVILGQQWWAVSWKTTQPDQTLSQMVLDHLLAFRA